MYSTGTDRKSYSIVRCLSATQMTNFIAKLLIFWVIFHARLMKLQDTKLEIIYLIPFHKNVLT